MILRRLTLALTAAAVFATSAAVAVIAVAFALYALLLAYVTPAGAAAIVAGAAAAVLALGALIIGRRPRVKRAAAQPPRATGFMERALTLVRDKPVVAIAAAIGAGFLVIRNPRYLGAAVRAFVEGRELPPAS
ncbi:MAG TPA: hypothetical protein VII63_03220 [Caulobacteraceae bacterium]